MQLDAPVIVLVGRFMVIRCLLSEQQGVSLIYSAFNVAADHEGLICLSVNYNDEGFLQSLEFCSGIWEACQLIRWNPETSIHNCLLDIDEDESLALCKIWKSVCDILLRRHLLCRSLEYASLHRSSKMLCDQFLVHCLLNHRNCPFNYLGFRQELWNILTQGIIFQLRLYCLWFCWLLNLVQFFQLLMNRIFIYRTIGHHFI